MDIKDFVLSLFISLWLELLNNINFGMNIEVTRKNIFSNLDLIGSTITDAFYASPHHQPPKNLCNIKLFNYKPHPMFGISKGSLSVSIITIFSLNFPNIP